MFFDSRYGFIMMFDANSDDIDFLVLVDGAETKYAEEKSFFARTMTIPLKNGSSQIEIIAPFQNP